MNRLKIAIILGQKPNYNIEAFKYFILSINKIQTTYEFFFPDINCYLFKEDIVIYKTANSILSNFIMTQNVITDFSICINTNKYDNNYFFNYDIETKTAAITTHIWDKLFSPPSLFEYLLHSIYTCLIYSKLTNRDNSSDTSLIKILSHQESKGCIADFTRNKYEDRIAITSGYICEKHTQEIKMVYGEDYLNEVLYIISRDWIGYKEDKGSIAYNLKHIFKFDIHKDSGFNLNWWEKCQEKFYDIPGESLSEIIKILLTAFITFLLVKYGISK